MRNGVAELFDLLGRRGDWMAWNTLLALIPLGLAQGVFRPGRRLTAGFWIGAIAFVLFLPNAPYPISDLIHYLDEVRRNDSNALLLGVTTPVFAAFVAVGFFSYVLCLRRVCAFFDARRGQHSTARRGPGLGHLPIELTLHALCAVGVYLGRVVRLNSWDVVVRPDTVAASIDSLIARYPVLFCSALFAVLVVATFVGRLVVEGVEVRLHRLRTALH